MTNWPDLELPPINLWNAPKESDMPKPDNLVALHKQMTGSYVVDAPKLQINPLDKWAVRLILDQKERIEELETMVKVFRGCIETGVFPKQGSPCHSKIKELVGAKADDAGISGEDGE